MDFLLGIIQTAIGAGFGFGFGLLAFRHQMRKQVQEDRRKEKSAAYDALNRLRMSALANMETLALCKIQFNESLSADVDRMKSGTDDALDASIEDRHQKVTELAALSSTMRHFYMSLPKVSVMSPPNFPEYSLMSEAMPALSLFVHRAGGATVAVNEHIESRNARIAAQALENGQADGMRAERILYYSSMLCDEGRAICEHTDFALNFWRLVLDQLEAYFKGNADGAFQLRYELLPEILNALPSEELTPKLREQLVGFDSANTVSDSENSGGP